MCNKQCFSKFTDEENFSCFWELKDKSVQYAYFHGLICVKKGSLPTPRTAQSSWSPRETSFLYVVSFQREKKVRLVVSVCCLYTCRYMLIKAVCRVAFVNVHGITHGLVCHLAFYAMTSPSPPTDSRGKQSNPRAMSQNVKKQISNHIKSFPITESYYGCNAATKGRKYNCDPI